MSRRSRRLGKQGERSWLGKAALVVVALFVVAIGIGYAVLRGYLHSDQFRKFLSAEASKVAAVNGEFAPFRWQGLAVDTDNFDATGEGLVSSVRADGLHTEIGLAGVTRGVWEVRGSSVRRLEISLDARKRIDEKAVAVAEKKSEKSTGGSGWLPSDAEVQGIDIREVTLRALLDEGEILASGMSLHAEQAGAKKSYRGEVQGGVIKLPFAQLPELQVDRLRARYQDGQVFLTEGRLNAWANGRISVTGEMDARSRQFSVEGRATGLKCEDLLSADWAKRLTGDVAIEFSGSDGGGIPKASGDLRITNAVLTALPMLDALAAYADTRRFRVITLTEAHTNWQWNKGEILLSNLVLSSEGLVRLEGSIVIRGRVIDGAFRLGLAPGTLASIPGAETDVFLPGERGLLWAPLRITGTLDDPKEDLTDRLVAAAGIRMFDKIPETGEKVIKFTRNVLGESPGKTVEQGVKIIEEGSKAVREVSGILDGILGGSKREEPEKEEP